MAVTRRDFLNFITVGGIAVGSAGLVNQSLAKAPVERILPFDKTVTEQHTKSKSDTFCHFNPEVLANKAVDILAKNMVLGNLVHRDHFNEEHLYGDVINTRRPGRFTTCHGPSVLDEDIHKRIKLDMHLLSTSYIDDSHLADGVDKFVESHVIPEMIGFARAVDDDLMWSMRNACSYHVKNINERETMLDARQQLNENLAFCHGRHMFIPQKWSPPLSEGRKYDIPHPEGRFEAAKSSRVLAFDLWKTDEKEALAFHREAMGLVNRPILTPIPKGARTFLASREHDLSIRCIMIHDVHTTLTRVIFETLFGTGILAPEMICTASLRS